MPSRDFTWSIFVYGSSALSEARQEVEDAITSALDGMGEVSGGGAGQTGWNIDIEVFNGRDIEAAFSIVKTVLLEAGALPSTSVDLIRAERRTLA